MAYLSRRIGHSLRPLPHFQGPQCSFGQLQCRYLWSQPRRAAQAVAHEPESVDREDDASMNGPSAPIRRLTYDRRKRGSMYLPWKGRTIGVSPVWARDSCTCSSCVDPSSGQKTFATVDIPRNIFGSVTHSDHEGVTIRWHNDIKGSHLNHSTTLNASQIASMEGLHVPKPDVVHRKAWTASAFTEACRDISYDEYMQDDSKLWEAISQLDRYGLLFLKDVPEDEFAVNRIAKRIGPLKNTFYGETWDVRSVPEAKNVAYTAGDLGFHMDLMYVEQPPALQLLHCIRSSAKGGASLFTDMYGALLSLFSNNRKAFDALCSFDVPYHYDRDGQSYHKDRKVVELNQQLENLRSSDAIQAALSKQDVLFAWSPPFQNSLECAEDTTKARRYSFDQWWDAAVRLNRIIHDQSNVYERMLKSGDCVIFANRRTLHARTAFAVDDAGKERWLKGAYIDSDVWKSRSEVLAKKFARFPETRTIDLTSSDQRVASTETQLDNQGNGMIV